MKRAKGTFGTSFTTGNVLQIFLVLIGVFLITGLIISASGGIQGMLQNLCNAVPQLCGQGEPTERSIEMGKYNTNVLVAGLMAVFTNDPNKIPDEYEPPPPSATPPTTGAAITLGEELGEQEEETGKYLEDYEKATVECVGIPDVTDISNIGVCCETTNYYIFDKADIDKCPGEIVSSSEVGCFKAAGNRGLKSNEVCCKTTTYKRKGVCSLMDNEKPVDPKYDEVYCGKIRHFATKCTVKNFYLKEDLLGLYGEVKEHLAGFGNPSFLVYWQKFPEGEDTAWKMQDNLYNKMLSVLWVFPVTKILGGALKLLGKGAKVAIKGGATITPGGKKITGAVGKAVKKVSEGATWVGKKVVYIAKRGASKLFLWKKIGNNKVKNYITKEGITNRRIIEGMIDPQKASAAKVGVKTAREEIYEFAVLGTKKVDDLEYKHLNLLKDDAVAKVLEVTPEELTTIKNILKRGFVVGATTGMITEFLAARDKCETEKFTTKPGQLVLQRPLMCEEDQMEKHDLEETTIDQNVDKINFTVGKLGMPLVLNKGFRINIGRDIGNPATPFYLASPCHADLVIEPRDVECGLYSYKGETGETMCLEPDDKKAGKVSGKIACGELFYEEDTDKFEDIVRSVLKEDKLIFDGLGSDGIYRKIIDPMDKKTANDKVIYEVSPVTDEIVCCHCIVSGDCGLGIPITHGWTTKEFCKKNSRTNETDDSECIRYFTEKGDGKLRETEYSAKPFFKVDKVKRVNKNGNEEDITQDYIDLDSINKGEEQFQKGTVTCNAEPTSQYKLVDSTFNCGSVVAFKGQEKNSRVVEDEYCEELENKPKGANICCQIQIEDRYECEIKFSGPNQNLGEGNRIFVFADENKKFFAIQRGIFDGKDKLLAITLKDGDGNRHWEEFGKSYDRVITIGGGGGYLGMGRTVNEKTEYYANFADSNGDNIFDSIEQKFCHITGVVVRVENMGDYEDADKARGESDVHNFCYQKKEPWKQALGTLVTITVFVADAFITLESVGFATVAVFTVGQGILAWVAHGELTAWPG